MEKLPRIEIDLAVIFVCRRKLLRNVPVIYSAPHEA